MANLPGCATAAGPVSRSIGTSAGAISPAVPQSPSAMLASRSCQAVAGGLGGAGEVVVALGGSQAAVAEQRRGEADLLGPVERDRGGGGIAEQMRVDRPAAGGADVGDNPAVGLLAAEPPAPGTIPCPAPAEQQPVRTTKMVLAAEYLDPLIAARVLDLGELADQHLDHGFLLLTRTEAYPVSTQIEPA